MAKARTNKGLQEIIQSSIDKRKIDLSMYLEKTAGLVNRIYPLGPLRWKNLSMNMFQAIYTHRLVLRQLRRGDKENFFAYRSLPEVAIFQGWHPQTIEEIEIFIEKMLTTNSNIPGTWFQIAICERATDHMIGDIGLHFPENNPSQVEIGYTLSPLFQMKGLASEAVKTILDYIFGPLEKHRVFASVDPQNHRSITLLERLGFRREAYFRKSLFIKGGWCDDVVYAMLEEEWSGKERMPNDPAK